jgi:protein gp37
MREFHKECHGGGRGPNHIWIGVSVEDSSKISRIRHLQESPVGVRFLSIEPLMGRMGRLNLTGID